MCNVYIYVYVYIYFQVQYNPYTGQMQPNPQMFGPSPSPINSNVFPFGQMGPLPPGSPGIMTPGPHVVSYSRPNVSVTTTETVPMSPAPYVTGTFFLFFLAM